MSKLLWLMSCAHIGEQAHNSELFDRYIQWAKRSKASILILGDLLDTGLCFGTRHIGSVWNNVMTPQEQINVAVQKLKPLAGNIIHIITGNHEARAESVTSVNPAKQVADRLSVPYSGANKVVRWNATNIFIAHGASSGLMTDFKKVLDAYEGLDIIALGHTHALFTQTLRRFVASKGGRLRDRSVHLVRCGNFLTDAEYARRAGYTPTPTGSAIVDSTFNEARILLGLHQ